MKTLNEKFTDVADKVSTACGTWPIFGISILLVISWLLAGPAMHYSDTWQLLVNTPTTVVELFLGLLQLAASNRIQAHTLHMMEEMDKLLRDEKTEEDEILRLVKGSKRGKH